MLKKWKQLCVLEKTIQEVLRLEIPVEQQEEFEAELENPMLQVGSNGHGVREGVQTEELQANGVEKAVQTKRSESSTIVGRIQRRSVATVYD